MSEGSSAEAIDGLLKSSEDLVEITLSSGNIRRRHLEYLPYPDWNFNEKSDDLSQGISVDEIGEQNPLEQIYSRCNKIFVPNQSVEVIKIEAERIYNPVTEFLHPYLYTITIRYGSLFTWTIKKRYKHFDDLHQALLDYLRSEFYETRKNSNNSDKYNSLNRKREEQQPCFPTQNDRVAFINESSIGERCTLLQDYLNKVLKHPKFREHIATRDFLEVSPLSFIRGLGKSLREGDLSKRSNDDYRGRSIFIRVPFMCDTFKFHHNQNWFVIKDSYLVYLQANSGSIGFPMLVDQGFSLDKRFRKCGTHNGIRIKNLQRLMLIKCQREDERDQWLESLMEIKNKSIFSQQHLFRSFAPKRQQQYAQWFSNGQSYMEALTKGILAAQEEIFITDWWLSPEIMLIRPFQDDSMRLDNLLGKRAEEGIRVYVMIFKDIVSLLGLNSLHSKKKLIGKSPNKKNIKVIRHPNHRVLPGTESSFLYSHHEKTVVIDQRVAFIGGIDLCWGRWDTDDYRLVDLGDENITELKHPEQLANEPEHESQKEEAGVDTTTEMAENTMNEKITSKPPTSPDQNSANVDCEPEINVIKHVNKRPSKLSRIRKRLSSIQKKRSTEENQFGYDPDEYDDLWQRIFEKSRQNDDGSSADEEQDMPIDEPSDKKPKTIVDVTHVVDNKCRFFMGKDYTNMYLKDYESLEKFDEDYIDRKLSPRMPWHDEALVVSGEAARDCARHFIQRWNIHKADKFRYNESYPYLLPKTYDDPELFDISFLRSFLPDDRPPIRIDAQCVRSASFWSCGIHTVERSVQNAYIHMIDSAQHFIYIENQFFITIAQELTIKNNIADALYRRIIRACINKEKFRIYVLLPLLPGFANANAAQAVLYFIMKSINNGENSLYQRLIQNGVTDPEEYITFYGVRNWDILMGTLVTEIIYVHSKIMIVDDRMCICGSANINDRSLKGSRDSEVCLVVNDIEMIDSNLNGQKQKVGVFCSTWRKKLFRLMLGIKNEEEINVDDPCSDEFYEYFRRIAKKNRQIYEEVFNTVPTNRIKRFSDIDAYLQQPKLKETDPQTAHDKCKQIQGFIVEFPIEFLVDDIIMPKWSTSEGIAPISLWT